MQKKLFRLVSFLMAVTLIASLMGCKNSGDPAGSTAESTAESTTWTTAPTETATPTETTVPETGPVETPAPAETTLPTAATAPAETTQPPQTTAPVETSQPTEAQAVHTHSYSKKATAATCSQNGYTTYTCSCGDSYKGDYVDATGHSYQKKVTQPTCANSGYSTYTCKTCGDSYKGDHVDATGHTWSAWSVTVEATYYTEGEQKRTCTACGGSETQSVPRVEMTAEMKQQEVLRLVNIEREKEGLAPLEYYYSGQAAADIRAKEITTYFSHERPDGTLCWTALYEQNISFYGAGENIAGGLLTPEAVVNAWMNSEGHRANILNPDFTHLIVGVEGNYWVQLFLTL